jgi:hypothetical protein
MLNPVKSTSVATNGADALAGSNPAFRSKNGNIDPASDPNVTMPTNDGPTVAHEVPMRVVNCRPDVVIEHHCE